MLIDRHLIRAQLQAFCIVFISLAGLTFVIDAFTNLEEFMLHAEKTGGLILSLVCIMAIDSSHFSMPRALLFHWPAGCLLYHGLNDITNSLRF